MTNEADIQTELEKIKQAIAAQEGLRGLGVMPDEQIDATLAQLRQKQSTLQARLSGRGVITQDSHLEGGDDSIVGSYVGRDAITGDHVTVQNIENQTVRQAPDPAQSWRDQLRRRYLGLLAHRCNILPLAALGGEESAKEEVSLADVYVSLDTTTSVTPAAAEQESALGHREERPLPAMEAATQNPRLALLGDPGSGKSTFVQQLAAQLAQAPLEGHEAPAGWPANTWPLLMLLRNLAPRLAGITLADSPTEAQEQQLLEAVLSQVQADLTTLNVAGLADDLPDILLNEPVVLILDGLDEVPEGLRRHVRLAVQAMLNAYPNLERVILTCRIRSYTGAAVLSNFAKHTLAPFDQNKIMAFVEAWYNTQTRLGRLTADQAQERRADLADAALSEALRDLAQNPMLLTTMAIIHQREVGLPRERVRLYDEAVKILLNRWQKRKDIPVSERLQAVLTDQLKIRQIMERLAYEVHQRQSWQEDDDGQPQGDLPRLETLALLEDRLYLGDIGLASEFLDYVDQRSGLLQGRGGEEQHHKAAAYTFPHRTFQEYLAGCHMVTGRSGRVAREYWRRVAEGDFWYLAALLGAEELLYNRRAAEDLLDLAYDLCPAVAAPANVAEWRAAVWSGQIATRLEVQVIRADDGTPAGGRHYLQRLVERLKGCLGNAPLKAIERSEAGRALGLLGDDRPGVALRPDGLPDIAWCEVPAGSFLRGSVDDKMNPFSSSVKETPQQEINLPAYRISRYPVTNAQYETFVEAGGYSQAEYWPQATKAGYWDEGKVKRVIIEVEGGRIKEQEEWAERPYDFGHPFNLVNHPVVGINWFEAIAFCAWLTGRLRAAGEIGQDEVISLPTESQWEKAARGPDGRLYPWGNAPDPERANYADTGLGTTTAVGCFPGGASPYVMQDMSGNVWEWCRTQFEESYEACQNNNTIEGYARRVLRGGAFDGNQRLVRCAVRLWDAPDGGRGNFGFRVLVSPFFS